MDAEIILFVMFVLIPLTTLVFVLPIVAVVKASKAKSGLIRLEQEVSALRSALDKAVRSGTLTPEAASAETIASPAVPSVSESTQDLIPAEEMDTARDVSRDTAAATTSDVVPSTDGPTQAEIPPPVQTPGTSIEERIGVVWFTRIGAAVGMVVAGWFFKYMVDNDWIGPWGRIALGAAVGTIVLGLGEWFYRRKRTHPMFNQGLLGLGLALLLITAYASFGFYHLIPSGAAFAVVALLCFFGGALAHHHQSEVILVFSLLAAFLNPILLSTGVDRPIALFSYLSVMTGAAYVLAVLHGFIIATFTATAGVLLLFTGWYGAYFDIHPAPPLGTYDDPAYNVPGAYLSMAVRWIPILFSTLFAAEWVAAALCHLKKSRRVVGTILLLIAATASHGAAAATLYDSPLMLGIALLIFGSVFAVLFIRYDLTEWLFLTMTSSFIILACLKNEVVVQNLLPLLTVSGLLSTLYFSIFLRAAVQKDRRPSPFIQWLIAGSGIGFFMLGLWFMMPDHFRASAVFTSGLTFVFLLTAVVIASPVLFAGASLCGFVGMVISRSAGDETDYAFVGIAALWFVVHAAIVSYDALVRRREWTFVHMFVLSFAGIAFSGLFLHAVPDTDGLIRAMLFLGEGLVFLVIGLMQLRSDTVNRRVMLLPLGMAALSFTAALGFLLTGASLTAAWAAEAAVLAYLGARSRGDEGKVNPGWLIASMAVFAAATIHFLSVDLPWQETQRSLYLSTLGAEGTLFPRAFLHPLAWGLITLGAACLFSVFFLRQQTKDTVCHGFRLAYLIFGHSALLTLFIHEFRLLFTMRPEIPAGLLSDEMYALWQTYLTGVESLAMQLQTVTTVVMGIYALLLIGIGFVIREAWHRRLGMMLFAATLVKLGLFDIWMFETLLKIIVGGAVAFLLLLGGFLYARFGARLRSIVSENDKVVSLLVFLLISSVALRSYAFEPEKYLEMREISGVNGPGDYALEVDPALYKASLCASVLCDIRIEGPDGKEVPYAVYTVESEESRIRAAAGVLDPQVMPDGSSRALLDLGETPSTHFRVWLEISGNEYLRRTKVESSADGMEFGVIAEDEPVYDIPSADARAEKQSLEYPASSARFLRITLKKGEDGQPLRIVGARFEMVGRRPLKDALREIPIGVIQSSTDTEGFGVFSLGALPPKVPVHTLRLETDDAEFVRKVSLESSTHKNAWFSEGSFGIYRIRRGTNPVSVLENLTLRTFALSHPFVRMKVDNGDNPPLSISRVFAVYTAEAVVFRAASAGPHLLYVGRAEDRTPRYDLAALIAKGGYKGFLPATQGALENNPRHQVAKAPEKTVPWTEKHMLALQILVGFIALVLLVWTVRLLRKGKRD